MSDQNISGSAMKRRQFMRLAAATVSTGGLGACGGGGASPAPPASSPSPSPAPTASAIPSASPSPTPLSTASAAPAGVASTLTIAQTQAPNTALLSASFASLSYEKNHIDTSPGVYFGPANANLIGLFNALGGGTLRIGANSVDRTTWTPAGAGQTSAQVAPKDVTNFAGLIKLCPNWNVIYGVNFASGSGSTGSPALAAQEATVVAAQLGTQLLAFEIGNEPDIYGDDDTPGLAGITYAIFLNGGTVEEGTIPGWKQFQAAMATAVPGAPFSGPAAADDSAGWAEEFAASEQGVISLLTEHYYISNYNSAAPSIAGMLTYPDPHFVAELESLQTAAQTHGVPFRIDECNSYFGSTHPSGVANVFAAALWAIDFIFTAAQHGAAGLNFHGGGAVSGYTPIGDDGAGNVTAVQPLFYALYLFTRMFAGGASGQLLNASLSATGVAVSAYAVKVGSSTYVVVNNKDTTNATNITIHVGTAATQAVVTVLASTGATPSAQLANLGIYNGGTAITYGGAAIELNGAWDGTPQQTLTVTAQTVTVNVAAANAALIKIT
ncbi:MAG TPA: hypothetical protein VME66_03225 [Candidatus Acidoferrales bacterium]|nr:hypothetical protein [Candidatus Acidoferrales bacterium]